MVMMTPAAVTRRRRRDFVDADRVWREDWHQRLGRWCTAVQRKGYHFLGKMVAAGWRGGVKPHVLERWSSTPSLKEKTGGKRVLFWLLRVFFWNFRDPHVRFDGVRVPLAVPVRLPCLFPWRRRKLGSLTL